MCDSQRRSQAPTSEAIPSARPTPKGNPAPRQVHVATADLRMRAEPKDAGKDSLWLYSIALVGDEAHSSRLLNVRPLINAIPVLMEVDTCADVTVASSDVWQKLVEPPLQPAPRLRTYGGSDIQTRGQCEVTQIERTDERAANCVREFNA